MRVVEADVMSGQIRDIFWRLDKQDLLIGWQKGVRERKEFGLTPAFLA